MQDFGHELTSRVAASQRALEAEGAAPLVGTPDIIRRKRAIRHGATALVAVVVLAVVATTGAFASQHLSPPPASPVPSVSDEPTITVSVSAEGPNPTIPNLGIACGDPAPVAAPSAGGFDLEVNFDNLNPSAAAEGYVTGSTRVTSTNVPAVPAFALQPDIVVVRDGLVVGVIRSAGLVNSAAFSEGHGLLVNDFWVGSSLVCEGDARELEAGDYEFYVVNTVAYSPQIAALAPFTGARANGLWFPEDPWLEPGDWECAHYMTWDGDDAALPNTGGPAACLPELEENVAWDADARAIVLPLEEDSASRVFSTQLIAGPFDFELSAAATEARTDGELIVDACDAVMRWDEDANSVAVYPRGMDRVLRDGGGSVESLVWPTFGPHGVRARNAQVDVPDQGRAVIIAQQEVVSDDGLSVGARFTVVGHALVTLNGGEEVTVARADGPANVPIDIEEVTWCDGEAPDGLAFGALSMTVFPDQLAGGSDNAKKLRFYGLG